MKRLRPFQLFAPFVMAAGLTVIPSVASAADPSSAGATDERARAAEQFRRGQEAFVRRDFLAAGRAFDEAFALSPHHDALWNAAQSWESGGELARAANRYAAYLRLAPPDAADRAKATELLARLGKRLGRLHVVASATENPKVDGEPVVAEVFYVYPGTHLVTSERAPGGREQEVSVGPQEDKSVSFGTEGAQQASPAVVSTTPPPLLRLSEKETSDATGRGVRALPPWTVLVGGGLTAVGAATTTFFGVRSSSAKGDFDRAPSAALLESGRADQTRTNVALGTTLGLAALTACVALFFVDWHETPTAQRPLAVGR